MWIVWLAALEAAEESPKRKWFVMELVTSAGDLGIHTYEALEERIRGLIWVEELFKEKVGGLRRDIERAAGLRVGRD